MASVSGSILPNSYFDGLSVLWGGCAYLGSAIVAVGLVIQATQNRSGPGPLVSLLVKVFFIGVTTLFIREWLMRLNDIVISFAVMLGVDPRAVDSKFVDFISGKIGGAPNSSVWDIIWGTKSLGTAVSYAFLWLFGWFSWALQYIVKLTGDILLTTGWALSPIFIAFFMLRPMAGVALKYIIGLVALVCWPFGWVIAAVVTNAMLEAAATASLIPAIFSGVSMVAPAITVLLVGAWMMISSILAPYVTTKVLLMGVNPVSAFASGVGGVAHAGVAGAFGSAATVATGGASSAGVIAAAAVGAIASAAESSARGGASARMTSTATAGAYGLYASGFARRQTAAAEATATAQGRRAAAAEKFSTEFGDFVRQAASARGRAQRPNPSQPHESNPNQAAVEIEAYAKS